MSAESSQAASKSKGKPSSNKSQWKKNIYSHKAKLQQFEERRRKSALHKYYKELKKSDPSASKDSSTLSRLEDRNQRRGANPYEKAKQEIEKRKKEKEQLKAQKEIQKAEREAALQKYKEDKVKKYIKLKKKNKKGQPVMAGRMELLLEKIQKGIGS